MFKIVVKTDKGEDFGVLTTIDINSETERCVISRQIGNPTLFSSMVQAIDERKRWHRNPECDHFSFEIEEVM